MPTVSSLLLVGASGRVGRMVCHHWSKVSSTELMISQRSLPPTGAAFAWSPLDGPRALLDHLALIGETPTTLIMLAGVTPGPGVDEATLVRNGHLAEACLSAAYAAGIGRVLLASSSAVYGVDPAGPPFSESSPPRPQSAYGRAKLAMEEAANPWRAKGVQVCALRIGNVAGADALLAPPLPAGEDTARNPPPLRIDAFADGLGPLRSYIGALTFARALAGLAENPDPLPAVLNLASPQPVRMTALAIAADRPYVLSPAPATAHQSITLDCSLLQGLIPFTSKDSQPTTMVQQWKATQV